MSRSSEHRGQDSSHLPPQAYIQPTILEKLRHLDLSGHVTLPSSRVVGTGAHGDVLKGKCNIKGQETTVAVKRLRFYLETDINIIFTKEIYVWSKLKHANILPLSGFAFEESSGYPFLVSEWMDNGSSWDYVKNYSNCDLMRLVSGIAKGLEYLHGKGIVHSDIKPANVVVTNFGDALICDFGGSRIAAATKSIAKPSEGIRGTSQYLAYELIVLSDLYPSHTIESDVWAFGMTVFALFAQKHPYAGMGDAQVMNAVLNRELPSFDFWTSRSTEEKETLRNICFLCWEFDPTRRIRMSFIVPSLLKDGQQKKTRPSDDREQDGPDAKRRKMSTPAALTDHDSGEGDVASGVEAIKIQEEDGSPGPLISLSSSLDKLIKCTESLSEVYQYLIGTQNVFTSVYDVMNKDFRVDGKLDHLIRSMEAVFMRINHSHFPENNENLLRLLQQATECCFFLLWYSRRSFEERQNDLKSSRKMAEFERFFVAFKDALDSGSSVKPAFITSRVSLPVDDSVLRQRLNIREVEAYQYTTCLSGTRVGVQEEIIRWAQSDSHQNIFWLHGVAGSGKSTVAASIEEYFRGMYRLGACLTCRRGKSDPSSVTCTLALKLALFDSTIGNLILAETDRNKDISSASLTIQIEKLIVEPLINGSAAQYGPVLIIIDALDECGTPQTRKSLIQILLRKLPKLPSNFRFLITSRREPDIEKILLANLGAIIAHELDYTSDASKQDVLLYIRTEMRGAVEDSPDYGLWEDNMAALSILAGGLFIWASTSVRLILLNLNPFKRLMQLVADPRLTNQHGLSELYSIVLRDSGIPWENQEYRSRFIDILGLILFGKTSLTIAEIDGLLDLSSLDSSRVILSRLQCLLAYSTDAPIRLSHTSFSDYLLSYACPTPCLTHKGSEGCIDSRWLINSNTQKSFITGRCFSVMNSMLRFNIGGIYSSYTHNDGNKESQARIESVIPSYLGYACHFWAQHLCEVPFDQGLVTELSKLLYKNLLYWLEVLSLLKSITIAGPALLATIKWIGSNEMEIASFVGDARRIINIFALPISQSAPHIYLSMLPLMADDSKVSAHYLQYTSSLVRVTRKGVKRQSPQLKLLVGHTGKVNSVDFSLDGSFIASGSVDRTVRIWDTEKGELFAGPFDAHVGDVHSVSFSPHSTRIVVGGSSGLAVLDVESGSAAVYPFDDEFDGSEIAISPDGKNITSASFSAINTWDVENKMNIGEPFIGHMDEEVWCVAYSRDGCFIVSGSWDGSVYIWDVGSRKLVREPFLGHKEVVNSVNFSPGGKYVVSGSGDRTIRVWDMEKGEVEYSPLAEHDEGVWYVVYSPDGTRIASGSVDGTIRIWNAQNGQLVAGPFANTDFATCVAFSPDGTRFVSGSDEGTLRIWDAEIDKIDSGPETNVKLVRDIKHVRFSADGACVISDDGSNWCIEDGTVNSEGSTEGEYRTLIITDGMQFGFKGILRWSLYTGDVPDQRNENRDYPLCIAISPNEMRIAFGSRNGLIRVWDEEHDVLVCGPFDLHLQGMQVESLSFSLDGKYIASVSGDVRVWEAETGKLLFGPFAGQYSVAYSPDGHGRHIASGSHDKTVKVWDVKTGCSEILEGHVNVVHSVAYSPDGSRIVSSSYGDSEIRVWSASALDTLLPMDQEQLLSSSSTDMEKWTLGSDGWIHGAHYELLLWIPHDLRPTLCRYRNIAVLNVEFSTTLDFSNSTQGERWHECFHPPVYAQQHA